MSYKLIFLFFTMILVLSSPIVAESSVSNDAIQTYRVRIPGTTKSCTEEAGQLAKRFTIATGIVPVETRCSGSAQYQNRNKSFTIYSLILSYSSPLQLTPFTIKFGHYGNLPLSGVNSTGDYYGPYTSYESCLNDLDLRTLEFEEFTKLNSVASYCSKALASETYVLTIESFGKTEMNLFTFNVDHIQKDELFQNEIKDHLISMGLQIVRNEKGRFYFYAPQSPNLVSQKLLSYQPIEICNSQINSARNIIKGITSGSSLFKCVPDKDFGELKYHLVSIYSEGRFLTNYKYREKFLTFEECTNDIARVLANENRYSGRTYLGGLCSIDSSSLNIEKYKMELFSIL